MNVFVYFLIEAFISTFKIYAFWDDKIGPKINRLFDTWVEVAVGMTQVDTTGSCQKKEISRQIWLIRWPRRAGEYLLYQLFSNLS